MKVGNFMTTQVVTVHPDSLIGGAARLMMDCKISGLPVVDTGGRVVGMVTEHDLLRRIRNGTGSPRPHWLQLIVERGDAIADQSAHLSEAKVEEVMTRDPVTVTEATPIGEACRLIEERGFKRLPVVRDGKLVGIISRGDLVRALAVAVRMVGDARHRDAAAETLMTDLQRQSLLHRARSRN
jgi:CBS domain-containing protein